VLATWVRWGARLAAAVMIVVVTVVLVRAFDARRLADLEPWHRLAPQLEPTAEEMDDDDFTLAEYLAREADVFEEARKSIADALGPEHQVPGNRYAPQSPNNPARFAVDWNRSFERRPAKVRGGALLVHGLSDSPYSLRAIADLLEHHGWYCLVLRMPGHGTVPGGLVEVEWRDWAAAVRLGARHVRATIPAEAPLLLVGYSNGGALVLQHQLEALEDATLPRAERLVLISPQIGISAGAHFARLLSVLDFVPYFEKSAWIEVQPEFNPFKYNSFPVNAAWQSHQLTREIAGQLERLRGDARLERLPPVLTFLSVLDTTVSAEAVVRGLYERLPANGSELVLFDINRWGVLKPLFRPAELDYRDALVGAQPRRYALSVLTNAGPDTRDAVELSIAAGSSEVVQRALGVKFPAQVFSLSHIALPLPPDDPLYGLEPRRGEDYGVKLGTVALRGERYALRVPMEQLARLGSNPFFGFMRERTERWIGVVPPPPRKPRRPPAAAVVATRAATAPGSSAAPADVAGAATDAGIIEGPPAPTPLPETPVAAPAAASAPASEPSPSPAHGGGG
jgi:alpha-beta hydrolase superfamily lysophospholipase